MANVFEHLDYRQYLQEEYSDRKAKDKKISYRFLARQAGFSSPNFLQLVMRGKRNLSQESVYKIAKALKLKKDEAEFFENLVRFNQSVSNEEKNLYYSRIAADRHYVKVKQIEKTHFEYYSKWYHAAVREMVLLKEFNEDPAWISRNLSPKISVKAAGESLALLERLGFVVRNKQGKLVQQDRYIDSGDEVMGLAIANYHREMIEKAAESIEKTPPGKREINSITFAVSQERMKETKKMIQEFRQKISNFLAQEDAAEMVYQLNLQLFNVSELPKEEEE
jgi:uncharacterized protein (TIGR02147 family)